MGNGEKILVDSNDWIPGSVNFQISSLVGNPSLKVDDLINKTNRTWDREFIHSTFMEEDAKRIFQIPLAATEHEGILVWRGETTGVFSVRSGYKILIE